MANGHKNAKKNRRPNDRKGYSHAHRGKPPGKPNMHQSSGHTASSRARAAS